MLFKFAIFATNKPIAYNFDISAFFSPKHPSRFLWATAKAEEARRRSR